MMARNTLLAVAVALMIGFMAGLLIRPNIFPAQSPMTMSEAPSALNAIQARGVQYFAANLDEARRVTEGCRGGSVRGTECANAEQAIIEAESRDRFKRFTDR